MSEKKRYFIENIWYAAAWEYEVAETENKLARTICETPLVFYKGKTDNYIALDDRCCHRAAPLSIGRVEGNCIRCMYHGMLYNENGQVVEIPGQVRVSKSLKVRSYPVVAKGGMIWIWMGDPELANENDIYDFPPLSDKVNWRGFDKGAYLHYDANWLLIVDNLADFSHVAFVHANTLGGSEAYAYSTQAENIQKGEDGFSMERWDRDSASPPFHAKVIPNEELGNTVDRANIIQMRLPGVFLMETLFTPVGWKEKDGRENVREYRNCQFMTPETRNTTHFFWNYLHNWEIDNSAISASLKESLLEGFMEDKVFIEGQQKLLERSPDFVPRSIAADEAFAHFRNKWGRRLRAEDEANPLAHKENKRTIL
ncbi:MAG: aromatic ring-hydroxylating dioxygenase subunit alpha [Porticoccaceae bacterium]|jgi:vanillate O-demethylase monooxygenase subunit|nr:aromatic ring-hydroxylating dioxygenase subunit alpha [Porticoccaceae bacterium]MBT3798969.1 aromatic ring-hydroxylating dioxygenase subunit alpha [Porticoccaceae bacterium]MBT4163315.1 aromatic ring-hydroxylating dioxygenase subunit alpha [Porticoccaceae bacterium]MBT4590481.1 aromatic ring-hydroxylating dioxygenase subunit alpha [Porticoccaceae bacterium]MBT5003769.1 aromatic ring-hydroxylating dioxygenase subunit alpha [Porticoccaceae bacterium]